MEKLNIPHSLALWIQLEVHERIPNGQLSAAVAEKKRYEGYIHCDSKEEASEKLQFITSNLQEIIKECQTQA
jgi:hypothetical protein